MATFHIFYGKNTGKTTMAYFLCHALKTRGDSVLAVDMGENSPTLQDFCEDDGSIEFKNAGLTKHLLYRLPAEGLARANKVFTECAKDSAHSHFVFDTSSETNGMLPVYFDSQDVIGQITSAGHRVFIHVVAYPIDIFPQALADAAKIAAFWKKKGIPVVLWLNGIHGHDYEYCKKNIDPAAFSAIVQTLSLLKHDGTALRESFHSKSTLLIPSNLQNRANAMQRGRLAMVFNRMREIILAQPFCQDTGDTESSPELKMRAFQPSDEEKETAGKIAILKGESSNSGR